MGQEPPGTLSHLHMQAAHSWSTEMLQLSFSAVQHQNNLSPINGQRDTIASG